MPRSEAKRFRELLPGVMYGVGTTFVCTTCLILILSIFVSGGRLAEEQEPILVMLSCFAGTIAGGITAKKKNCGSAMISGIGTAVVSAAIRLIISMFSETGSLFDKGDALIILSMICGGILSGAVSVKKKRRRH